MTTAGTWYPPAAGTGGFLLDFTNPPFAMPAPPRRFVSLTRTICQDGNHVLDAIDEDGRVWWLNTSLSAPEGWTELQPLPSREDQP